MASKASCFLSLCLIFFIFTCGWLQGTVAEGNNKTNGTTSILPSAVPSTISNSTNHTSSASGSSYITSISPTTTHATPTSTYTIPNATLFTPNATLATPNSTLATPNATLATPNATLATPNATLATPNATSPWTSELPSTAAVVSSTTPTFPTSPTGKSGKDYDSMKKRMWVAAAFAIIFAITTVILGYLVYRQRKINRELEGDPSTSRLL